MNEMARRVCVLGMVAKCREEGSILPLTVGGEERNEKTLAQIGIMAVQALR